MAEYESAAGDVKPGDECATPFEVAERILVKCRKRRIAAVADVETLARLIGEMLLSEDADAAEGRLLDAVERAERTEAELAAANGRAEKAEVEVERHHTWRGLMSLLDEHYPADVFTGESGDEGPRIVVLIRALDEARTRLAAIGRESGWVAAENADPDEHRPFTMADYREQLGGAGRRPRIGEEQR